MRARLLTSSLVIVLAACGMPAATGKGTPAPATGETVVLPSATPLPTGEPMTPIVEPLATPMTLPTDEARTPAGSQATPVIEPPATNPTPAASPQPAPATPPAAIAATPVPPPPNVTAPALPSPALQPPPATIVEQAVLPDDLLARLIDDLALRSGSDPAAITLVGAEAVIWNDGSLGCPQPGIAYPQVLVEGYRVLLRIGDREYDYRVGRRGTFVLCEQNRSVHSP
ncbi:MAG: hypothetical protein ACUVSY_07515 [Roseiflexus sp.]